MIPYLILIFVPLIFLFVASTANIKEYHGKWSVSIGMDQRVQNNSLLIPVFFVIFFILLALRDESIGRDLGNYKVHFESVSHMTLKEVFLRDGDLLYDLLAWAVGRFTKSYRVFLIIVAALVLIPIANLYSEDRRLGFLKILLFMNLPVFVMIFSGLRQSIAFAIGCIAYKFVRKKQILPFLALSFVAFGFHHSAFIVFLLYPLYHIKLTKRHLWFIIPSIAVVFIYNKPIFLWLTNIANMLFGEDYSTNISNTNAYAMLILFILLALFAYIVADENKIDEETSGLRNFLLFSVVLQCFSPVHTLAMRMNYYYILFIPILIPKIIKNGNYTFKEMGYIANGVMTLFFLAYYLITLYNGCTTGVSSLDTYPYAPFWQ